MAAVIHVGDTIKWEATSGPYWRPTIIEYTGAVEYINNWSLVKITSEDPPANSVERAFTYQPKWDDNSRLGDTTTWTERLGGGMLTPKSITFTGIVVAQRPIYVISKFEVYCPSEYTWLNDEEKAAAMAKFKTTHHMNNPLHAYFSAFVGFMGGKDHQVRHKLLEVIPAAAKARGGRYTRKRSGGKKPYPVVRSTFRKTLRLRSVKHRRGCK